MKAPSRSLFKAVACRGSTTFWGVNLVRRLPGGALRRNAATPILGRVGPITLVPHEHQNGLVPISAIFPDLPKMLAKGAVVSIRWKYWTGVKTAGSVPFEGSLVLRRDPCGEER